MIRSDWPEFDVFGYPARFLTLISGLRGHGLRLFVPTNLSNFAYWPTGQTALSFRTRMSRHVRSKRGLLHWATPELFKRSWAPKSMGMPLRSCEMDVRFGGKYRLEFEGSDMAFLGTYLEVTPYSRLAWTNAESGESGPVTTVTFAVTGGTTLLVLHELHSSKEALDAAGTGVADGLVETFARLDELVITLIAR